MSLPPSAAVVIVGYGPVGKLLALQLGRRGHDVLVLDRNAEAYPLPRAVTHCSDLARILQDAGLPPDEIGDITRPYDDMYVWRNGAGRTLVEVDWSGIGESGWYNTYFFHQPALEGALDEVIARLGSVTVHRGAEVVAMESGTGSVRLTVRDADGDHDVTAPWVIGADGANSRIRTWAGIETHDDGYFFDWLVVDVRTAPGTVFPHIAEQHCDPARPSTMVPGGPGRRRWEFMRLPHETAAELSRPERVWELLAPYGLTAENAELERHSVYTFQSSWATRWRCGRVLIAGDAAHLMPPFAGQGLGAGARDAMNLSWKLDAVLRGLADERLLDTYTSERLQHAAAFVRFSTDLGRVICVTDPDAAAARDTAMIDDWSAGMKPPAPPRPGLGPGAHRGTHGGTLSLQGRVRVAGRAAGRFDDAFGGPGALITRSTSDLAALAPAHRDALAALGISLVSLGGEPRAGVTVVEDVDGVYTDWLARLGHRAVLIRPDFHVFAAADDADSLAGDFLAHLTPDRAPAPHRSAHPAASAAIRGVRARRPRRGSATPSAAPGRG